MSLDQFVRKKETKQKVTNEIKKPIQINKEEPKKDENDKANEPIKKINFGKKMKWVYNHDHDFSEVENKILKTISSPSEQISPLSIWTIWALNRDIVKSESEVDEIINKLMKKYKIERIEEWNNRKNWVKYADKRDRMVKDHLGNDIPLWVQEIIEVKNHKQIELEEEQNYDEIIEEKGVENLGKQIK